MTFTEIYMRIIPLWGTEITFEDGVISQNESGLPGFYSATLSNLYSEIESKSTTISEFDSLMSWTMFQIFHSHASKLFKEGTLKFDPLEISRVEIENQYFENLNGEGYEKELKQYIRDIS